MIKLLDFTNGYAMNYGMKLSPFPASSTPYYIVSPPYRRYSAGVKVLHFLCHALNQRGQKAYIILSEPAAQSMPGVHPLLQTPLLSNEERAFYMHEGIDPIVVYPELIRGNPLNTSRVVRYLLYFAGAFGGEKKFPSFDTIVSYSRAVRDDYGSGSVLTIPTSDPTIFYPPPSGTTRAGKCFYSSKHRMFGGQLDPITQGCTEITKDFPKSSKQLADLLRGTEALYAYEDTSLIMEALLCGCPVVRLDGKKGFDEFGLDGIAFSKDPAELEKARTNVGKAWKNYADLLQKFETELTEFIDTTQKI